MPSAAPTRMYARQSYFNSQTERRVHIISVPLITALLDQPRYSIADPRLAPPAPPRPAPAPKRETTGRAGRPKGSLHVKQQDDNDPLLAALWDADDINAPLPVNLAELERRR